MRCNLYDVFRHASYGALAAAALISVPVVASAAEALTAQEAHEIAVDAYLVLGTAVILVLAHEEYGVVKAAIAGKAVPGQISDLFATIKANAQMQASLLSTASPILADLLSYNRLKVTASYDNLGNGAVTLLG